ncbi:hypothetical protein [Hyalangium gracile]|uniref:hypothetical protein n=1 Tax=Hyalangium gracile TaxID=394092 RepID=UPI001CCC420A|nr:hypothetical protein [Hyalangium gracile]
MKVLWCWRCQMDVPMLDEDEFQAMWRLYSERAPGANGLRQEENSPLRERFLPMLEEYKRLTGMAETNPNAVVHHRLSLYGPPCAACGKPLRTPQARHCAACGAPT